MADTRVGCTSCGAEETVTMDGVNGRRCADCPPTYDRAYALALVNDGNLSGACAHLRTMLAYRLAGSAS